MIILFIVFIAFHPSKHLLIIKLITTNTTQYKLSTYMSLSQQLIVAFIADGRCISTTPLGIRYYKLICAFIVDGRCISTIPLGIRHYKLICAFIADGSCISTIALGIRYYKLICLFSTHFSIMYKISCYKISCKYLCLVYICEQVYNKSHYLI